MKTSIVLELQHKALDEDTRVTELLRKALVISRKLGLHEFGAWLDHELNGYDGEDIEIPKYRELRGEPQYFNQFRGWMPILFGPKAAEVGEAMSRRRIGQRIAEIEELVKGDGDSLMSRYSYQQQARIAKAIGHATQSALVVSKTDLVGVLDAVRNIILNWALELEQKSVLGEGLTFTAAERHAAEHSPQQINYYIGSIAGAAQFQQGGTGSQIQLNKDGPDLDAISSFIAAVHDQLEELGIDESGLKELRCEIATLKAQTQSPRPKRPIIQESLISVRRILEGATGSAGGQLLILLGRLLTGA